jgi:hypothetical protein
MTRLLALTFCLVPTLGTTAEIAGYVEFGASAADAEPAWTEGGVGTSGRDDGLFAEARLSVEQRAFDERVLAFASVLARSDEGRHVGLIEAFVDVGRLSHEGYRLRLGQAFAGTSRENIEAFWQTPYTLTLSALNSWIGEEFRPIGAELTRRFQLDERSLDVGLTAYVGNDTGPAALAWRGFALHNRVSVFGEALPLLPLPSLSDPQRFGAQRSDGTQPFGPDLDGRIGYALRGRFDSGRGLRLSAYYTDNRGDQDLHDGDEYAWNSQFAVLGFDWQLSERWTLLGEVLHGATLMGFPPGPNVDIDFDAAYLLLSFQDSPWTWSGRIEAFHISEKDRSFGELNTQNGHALTFAVLREWSDWRIGAELLVSDITRPGNAEFAGNTDQGGVQAMLLARRYF